MSIGKVAPEAVGQVEDLDGRIEAIQWLIPLGLKAVTEKLQRAVVELAGPRYERKGSDQPLRRTEVLRRAYQALQTPRQIDEGLLLRMLKGIATRNYEACAETVPEAFGLSRSPVSRRDVKGTARKLAEFQGRSLEGDDLVALVLDGKSFADEEISIALGVTLDGQKIPLGFVQAATGNERVCRRGTRGACLRAALPVSQAPKRRVLPAQERAGPHPSQDGGGLRQTDVRGGQGRAGRAQTGLGN